MWEDMRLEVQVGSRVKNQFVLYDPQNSINNRGHMGTSATPGILHISRRPHAPEGAWDLKGVVGGEVLIGVGVLDLPDAQGST
ncbi:MAG: hypothetical protein P8Y63_08530, partial [Deltaproteobacteria bacterium]